MERKTKRKIIKSLLCSYLIVGLVSLSIGIGGIISTSIEMDRQYQGYFYLAESAESPRNDIKLFEGTSDFC